MFPVMMVAPQDSSRFTTGTSTEALVLGSHAMSVGTGCLFLHVLVLDPRHSRTMGVAKGGLRRLDGELSGLGNLLVGLGPNNPNRQCGRPVAAPL